MSKPTILLLCIFLFGLWSTGCNGECSCSVECAANPSPGSCPVDDVGLNLAEPEQQIPEPVFVVSLPGTERVEIRVSNAQGELWKVHANSLTEEEKVTQFYYGQELPGFTTLISPQPLEVGQEYHLSIDVNLAHDGLYFYVDEEGIIHKEEKADA